MSIHIDNLSYRKDLFALSEAMLYAFNREPKSDDDEQTKRYWVGQILSTSKLDVCKQIEETKNKYSKELSNSHKKEAGCRLLHQIFRLDKTEYWPNWQIKQNLV